MQHSEQPYVELERARKAIEAMRQSQSLVDLEEHWKDYLRRIERAWNKSVSHFGKSPKWNGWQGKYLKLRKDDPLLSYLVNARGADEHTVGEITQRNNGSVAVKSDGSRVTYIERMEIRDGQIIELRGSGFYLEFVAAHVQLLPITNRGVKHEVPSVHLSRPVDPRNLLDIAEKGIQFYEGFLTQAEAFFIQPADRRT